MKENKHRLIILPVLFFLVLSGCRPSEERIQNKIKERTAQCEKMGLSPVIKFSPAGLAYVQGCSKSGAILEDKN